MTNPTYGRLEAVISTANPDKPADVDDTLRDMKNPLYYDVHNPLYGEHRKHADGGIYSVLHGPSQTSSGEGEGGIYSVPDLPPRNKGGGGAAVYSYIAVGNGSGNDATVLGSNYTTAGENVTSLDECVAIGVYTMLLCASAMLVSIVKHQ